MVRVVTSGSESVRTFFPVSATTDGATDGVCSETGGKMTASRATKYQGIGCVSGSGAENLKAESKSVKQEQYCLTLA